MADPLNPLNHPVQQLVDLINSDNDLTLTLDDISISLPEAVNFSGRNTKVTLTAKENSAYAGIQEIYYNRLALTRLGYMGVLTEVPLTIDQILAMLSAEKRIDLLKEEFEEIIMPVLEEGEISTIALRSKPNAIKWYGETEIDIVFGLPDNITAFHTFLHTTLPSEGYLF